MKRTTSHLPIRVLEVWFGPQEDWGLSGMNPETWRDHPTDSILEEWDLYNLENYVHEEVDVGQYLDDPGIYMVVKQPSLETDFYGFPFNNSEYAELKTQGFNRIEVTTNPDYEMIFTPYVKPFPWTPNKNDQTHFSMTKKDERFLSLMAPKVPGSEYKYYKLYSYRHTTFESVLRILNWYPFPKIFID